MSWKIAILIALITAIITAVVTAPVSDHVMKKMGVSNFEGGRGYAVILFILLGFVGGLAIGLITTRVVGAVEWNEFWKAAGFSLLASHVVLFGIAGLCLLSKPKPPLLDGHLLDLEAEIFLPKDLQPKDTLSDQNPRASLYASRDDNQYVEIDHKSIRPGGDMLVIPSTTRLNTISGGRMLSITLDDTMSYTLDMPLQPSPRKEDLEWTEHMPMRNSNITGNGYTFTEVMVRYRVVKAEKPAKD